MRRFAALKTYGLGDLLTVSRGQFSGSYAGIACVGPRRLAASRKDSQNAPIATLGMRGRNSAGNSPFSRPPEAPRAS